MDLLDGDGFDEYQMAPPLGVSTAGTSTGIGALGRPVPSIAIRSSDPSAARRKRKRLLQQRRMVWGGAAAVRSRNLECGQFDEEFVAALKVSYPGRSCFGPPEYECSFCHALFWYGERVGKQSRQRTGHVVYNKCCKGGKVVIPAFQPRPEPLNSLARFDGGSVCNKFMKNIRQYNCLFAFTSMGADIDRSLNDGQGPPIFKICGQIHHRLGAMVPPDGQPPKFIQLYIYDTANEVQNRIQSLSHDDRRNAAFDPAIVESLVKMLDDHNPLVQQFRMARDRLQGNEDQDFFIQIVGPRDGEPVQYNLPSADQLAMLVVGDFGCEAFKRDIIVQTHGNELKQISALHPAFMPLQYPLLFPFAERGFQTGVLYAGLSDSEDCTYRKITMQDYFCYMFHYKKNQPNPYLCYGQLSSQAKVDARACVDENRLTYLMQNQEDIRMESIQGISDAVSRGSTEGADMGKLTILPASFTGGKRYMIQNYHDGIAICREYGPPDFFVTFTCNPKWVEIAEGMLEAGQRPSDRSDVIVRVFNMKLEELLHDITDGNVFGPCSAVLHTVEFQKRGLPHAHIILWAAADTSNPTPSMIDKYVSAEIPDPKKDPLGYVLVAEHMIHGPCGAHNPRCPCMKKGKCSKFFPKPYHDETTVDSKGFAMYRRCQNNLFIDKGGMRMDNRWVVPYNIKLLKKYQAHINVEWCNKTTFIKYLFKYVTKGADCSKAYLRRVRQGDDTPFDEQTQTRNEIREYLDCRYICEFDACWRILGYDIHRHHPAVERMPVHLPNENYVTFSARQRMDKLLAVDFLRKTMLTEWFVCNEYNPDARELTYCQFPSRWRWESKERRWKKRSRQRGKIGRLHYVHPSAGERYYLRMLLLTVKGSTSFEELRFHNCKYHLTFKEACRSRGLLGDDLEWYNAFDEAATWATSPQLRRFFVTMILFCHVGDEHAFFEKVWRHLCDDIQYQYRDVIGDPNCQLSDARARDFLLDELATIFAENGRDIRQSRLPRKTLSDYTDYSNRLIEEELSYPVDPLLDMQNPTDSLNPGQTIAFDAIVQRVMNNEPGFFFVSGYGGTGKTYLWNCIVGYLRGKGKIVLTVASSGVAALLLPGGRTAHSRFRIPCDLDDDTICDVGRGTILGDLIAMTSVVIWDEALMANRKAFEALDRSFKDIEKARDPAAGTIPFGGKVVVLGGDLRQILPVVEGGNKLQVLNATVIKSHLWVHVEVLNLTQNMRLVCSSDDPIKQREVELFSRWILDLGEGKLPSVAREGEVEPSWVKIPSDLLVTTDGDKLACIFSKVYPSFEQNYLDIAYLGDRAILTPTNELADAVNEHAVSLINSPEKEYLSADSIEKTHGPHEAYNMLYPVEYLNSLNGNNFPQHRIKLKKGVPIMLLRNLNQIVGLCNGTRLIIISLGDWTIEAQIMNGRFKNQVFTIPRINLTLKSNKWPFELRRRQYPIKVCYAMTINKSQGQTLMTVGIYLKRPVFSHGQLYVAVSRVTRRQGLKILIEDEHGNCSDETRNVVYKEVPLTFISMDAPLVLANLHKGKEKRPIVVRVVRKYTMTESQGNGEPLYVGMVLADVQGEAIYAEIPKQHMEKQESMFEVGEICKIMKFMVRSSKQNFKVIDRPLMIEISYHTIVESVIDPPRGIPERIYTLTDFAAVAPSEGPIVQYTDVVGYLTKYTQVDAFVPKNRENVLMLRELYIKDLSDREMKVTIWGDYATNFSIDHVYDHNAGNIVVCLILGCAPRREFRNYNKIYLSAAQPFAYYLNPQIPEAQPYYDRFKQTPLFIDRPPPVANPQPAQVKNITLELKTLAELNDIEDPFEFEDGTYKCTVTITAVIPGTRWWYMACRPCKKKAVQQDDGCYRCVNCNGTNTAPRYLLSFLARDDTAEARFFAHDTEARIIVGKDCEAVMSPLGFTGGLPQQVLNIVDKKYTFSIDLEDGPIRQYVIKAVLAKPSRRPIHPSTPNPSSGPSTLLLDQNAVHEVGTSAPIEQGQSSNAPPPEVQAVLNTTPSAQTLAADPSAQKDGPSTDIIPGHTSNARRSLAFSDDSPQEKETPPGHDAASTEGIADDETLAATNKRLRSGGSKQGKNKSTKTGGGPS